MSTMRCKRPRRRGERRGGGKGLRFVYKGRGEEGKGVTGMKR